jgi:hypothetical protein
MRLGKKKKKKKKMEIKSRGGKEALDPAVRLANESSHFYVFSITERVPWAQLELGSDFIIKQSTTGSFFDLPCEVFYMVPILLESSYWRSGPFHLSSSFPMELMSHFWDKRKKRGGKRNPFMSKKYGQ